MYPKLLEELTDIRPTPLEGGTSVFLPAAVLRLLANSAIIAKQEEGNPHAEIRFRILELELYHPDDPYTHGSPEQKGPPGLWYFHRAGKNDTGKFKGGTFKGLDVTCAEEGKPGGLLIRAVSEMGLVSIHGQMVEAPIRTHYGPCKSVEALLEAVGASSIDELVTREDYPACLRIEGADPILDWSGICVAPRVGLSVNDKPHSEFYRVQNFRYVSAHALSNIKKEKTKLKHTDLFR